MMLGTFKRVWTFDDAWHFKNSWHLWCFLFGICDVASQDFKKGWNFDFKRVWTFDGVLDFKSVWTFEGDLDFKKGLNLWWFGLQIMMIWTSKKFESLMMIRTVAKGLDLWWLFGLEKGWTFGDNLDLQKFFEPFMMPSVDTIHYIHKSDLVYLSCWKPLNSDHGYGQH